MVRSRNKQFFTELIRLPPELVWFHLHRKLGSTRNGYCAHNVPSISWQRFLVSKVPPNSLQNFPRILRLTCCQRLLGRDLFGLLCQPALFLFTGKRDGGLWSCTDYRGLIQVTKKVHYSLPFFLALEQFHVASFQDT